MFSADTPEAGRWMRKRYGRESAVFSLPAENSKAVALKEAAVAEHFTIIVLMRRPSANV
jgi:hypothetical protein